MKIKYIIKLVGMEMQLYEAQNFMEYIKIWYHVLYKQSNKIHFLYVFILQFLYNSTCFERPFLSSSGVHDLLYSAAPYKPCCIVKLIALNVY